MAALCPHVVSTLDWPDILLPQDLYAEQFPLGRYLMDLVKCLHLVEGTFSAEAVTCLITGFGFNSLRL